MKDPRKLYVLKFIWGNSTKTVSSLMVYGGEKDFAIKDNGKLLFVSEGRPAFCPKSYSLAKKKYGKPHKTSVVIDFEKVLKYVLYRKIDPDFTVLNCINTYWDLLLTINQDFPAKYRKSLFQFADHLTFSRRIDTFIENYPKYDRRFLTEGIRKAENILIDNSCVFISNKNRYMCLKDYLSQRDHSAK